MFHKITTLKLKIKMTIISDVLCYMQEEKKK